ncbi:MAG: ABC transporter ATP-binding protein [Pseudomonadota bacterium]
MIFAKHKADDKNNAINVDNNIDSEAVIDVRDIDCVIGNQTILEKIRFHLRPGCIGGLLGPSGCGKTTTLRAIAGFQPIQAGSINMLGRPVSSQHIHIAAEKRGIGLIFQDYALFPHLTVEKNVAFGIRQLPRAERKQRVEEYLSLVKLNSLAQRFPDELSGGQKQRVALARALAPHPKLLLLDEPFSNLDTDLRSKLSLQVRDILRKEKISALLVTHDQAEAFAICDQIGVMQAGHLEQWDTPYNLYHEPINRFVANFIGQGRMIRGVTLDKECFDTELGKLTGDRAYLWNPGSIVDILIRPDDVIPDPESPYKATVQQKTFRGAFTHYQLRLASGAKIDAQMPSHSNFEIGDSIGIRIEADHLVAFFNEQ